MSSLHNIPRRTRTLPPLRVGVGGPVGSGKTTLVEMLCKAMRERYDLVVITNDIYTKEDQRLLTVAGALDAERIMGVQTGGFPHPAPRGEARSPPPRRSTEAWPKTPPSPPFGGNRGGKLGGEVSPGAVPPDQLRGGRRGGRKTAPGRAGPPKPKPT